MASRVPARGLFLLAVLALSIPALAAPMKKAIHIQQPLQAGDITLAPGDYNLTIDGNEATFEQGHKIIAKVPCEMRDSGGKNSQNAVVYANGAITEIRLAGQSQVVTFSPVTGSTPSKSPSSSSGDR